MGRVCPHSLRGELVSTERTLATIFATLVPLGAACGATTGTPIGTRPEVDVPPTGVRSESDGGFGGADAALDDFERRAQIPFDRNAPDLPSHLPVFGASLCSGSTAAYRFDSLQKISWAAPAPDSVALWIYDPAAGLGGVTAEVGWPCKAATDRQACFERRASTYPNEKNSLVLTQGDRVEAISTAMLGAQRMGPVDSIDAAVLAATLEGYEITCDQTRWEARNGEFWFTAKKLYRCSPRVERFVLVVSRDGHVRIDQQELGHEGPDVPLCVHGRRPAALASSRGTERETPIGSFFANAARLEAASVIAFAEIERELRTLQAPFGLLRRVRRARRDEIRHATQMARLAHRYGTPPLRPVAAPRPRTVFEQARDNAVEGCVRETFGALVAAVQARKARDLKLRRTFRAIARDERRHAALSWDLARFYNTHLRESERREVRALVTSAWQELERSRHEFPAMVHDIAGMPEQNVARRLVSELLQALDGSALGSRV